MRWEMKRTMLKMCEKTTSFIHSVHLNTHKRYTVCCMQAWLYGTPSQLTLEKLEHGGLPCTGSLLDAVHLHDVLQRSSCINHRIIVRYSGEVQQDFHRTHVITCIKCRTCRWLLFVRAVPFVSTVLIIRHIAIRLCDQGSLPVIVVDSCRVDGIVHTTKSFHSTSPSKTRVLWSGPDTCSDLKWSMAVAALAGIKASILLSAGRVRQVAVWCRYFNMAK